MISEDRPSLQVTLKDGTAANLRPVTPQDRDLFVAGLESLSEQSRFLRFGRGVSRLTQSDLRYLTDVDQRSHVAWGAIIGDAPAGVGRYIVVPEEGGAEVAITVVDRFQGLGLGRLLFQGLVAVARLDGVPGFFFEVRRSNTAVMRILRDIDVMLDGGEDMVKGRIQIVQIPEAPTEPDFVAVMTRFRKERPSGEPGQSSGSRSSESELTQ